MDKYRKIQAHARVLVKPKKSNKLIKKFYEHFEPIYLSLCLFVMFLDFEINLSYFYKKKKKLSVDGAVHFLYDNPLRTLLNSSWVQ